MGCPESCLLNIGKFSIFNPGGKNPRFYDRLDTTASVCNRFANASLKYLVDSSKQFYEKTFLVISLKYELQACSTSHHDILIFWKLQ